jgi:hypothetical protein
VPSLVHILEDFSMKKFKDLEPGDKIYSFLQDEIHVCTVTEKGKAVEYRFGYFGDENFKQIFIIKTDNGDVSFYCYDENKSINYVNNFDSDYGLFIMATSIEEIEQSLKDLYDKEVKTKEDFLNSVDERIKRRAAQLENFRITRDKEKLEERKK